MDRFPSRAGSRVSSLFSLLAIVGLLLGVPLALMIFVGWPLPRDVPSWDQIRNALEEDGVDTEVIINGLAIVVWLAWAQLAWALLAETMALVKGRNARQVFAFPGTQLMARRLVASAALVLSSFGSVRVANATPLAPLAPLQEIEPAADPSQRSDDPISGLYGPSTAGVSPEAVAPTPPAPTERIYEVQRGDTFWGLADRFMGGGMRWRELRDRNVGRAVAPGRVLAMGEDHLDVGWRLLIPVSAATPGSEPLTAPPSAAPAGTLLSTLPDEAAALVGQPDAPEPPTPVGPVESVESVGPVEPAEPAELTALPTEPAEDPVPQETAAVADVEADVLAVPDESSGRPAAVQASEASNVGVAADAASHAGAVSGLAAQTPSQPMGTLVVEPGDHFWALAERQLTEAWGRAVSAEEVAPYWRNLVDANQARIRSGDPDLIFPGEQLSAPPAPQRPEAAATPAPPPPTEAPPEQEPPPTDEEETPPTAGPATTEAPATEAPAPTDAPTTTEAPATEAPAPTDAPTTTEAPTTTGAPTTTEAPDTTESAAPAPTGTVTTGPPTTAEQPPSTEAPTESTAPDESATVLDTTTDVEGDEDEEAAEIGDDEDPFPFWLVAGSAAFAGLVLAALARRRRARRRLAGPDDIIEGRRLEDIRTEKAYAVMASDVPDVVANVSRALGAVIAANAELPPITAVVIAPLRTVAVYFAEPCLPVAPFLAGPPSDRWDLYLDELGDDPGFEHASAVLDTLTVLGRTDTDEWVFVDIESLGAVELAGDPQVAAELAQSMVAELSLQPAGDPLVDLTVIGMDRLSPVVADVVSVEHLDQDLVNRFERTAEETGAFLDRQGLRSTAAARAQGVERDGLFVTVVAYGGAEPADPVLLERMAVAATPGGRGVAVVAVGPLGAGATRIVVTDDGRAHVPRLGITVTAARLAREDLDRVAHMLAREPDRPTPGPPREPAPTGPDVDHHMGPYEEPPWHYCVRIFADHLVETRDGEAISFRHGENPEVPNKNTMRGPELLAYLALSGRAASATDIRDHLWWDRPVALATVNKLIYGTRKVLGGADMLSLAQDDPVGRYRLSLDVVTDAELLHHALEHAHRVASTDPDLAVDLLRAHLSQIEAVAFRSGALGQGLTEWASAYRVIDRVEQPVIDASLLMAKLCTGRGTEAFGEALWAVDQGLKACPVNEALVRAAMELEAWLGSPEAANGRYQNLAHRLASDELEPEPETNELRARLRRSGRVQR